MYFEKYQYQWASVKITSNGDGSANYVAATVQLSNPFGQMDYKNMVDFNVWIKLSNFLVAVSDVADTASYLKSQSQCATVTIQGQQIKICANDGHQRIRLNQDKFSFLSTLQQNNVDQNISISFTNYHPKALQAAGDLVQVDLDFEVKFLK